jgi:hypothetical protein
MDEPEIVSSSPRYVLAIGQDSYLLLDRRAMEEPVATFPLTDEGFEAAEERFAELKRLDRRERLIPKGAWLGVLIGVALWVLGGLAFVILGGPFPIEVDPTIAGIAYVLDSVGFRTATGGLILLASILLLRWEGRQAADGTVVQRAEPAAQAEPPESQNVWDAVSSWALGIGLVLWILLAAATGALSPFGPGYLPLPNEPSRLSIVIAVVESLAFRIWVGASIFKLVRWSRLPLRKTGTRR